MIPVEYYTDVYYFIISFIILLITLPLFKYKYNEEYYSVTIRIFIALLLVIVVGFIGLRDPYGNWRYLGDTSAYTRTFENIQKLSSYKEDTKDIGFYIYMWITGMFLPVNMFYLLSAFLYVIPLQLSFNKWFGKKSLYALAIYISAMSFWAFGINGVRNGLATSFIIYAFSKKDRKLLMFSIMFVAASFHKSVLLPIVAYFVASKITNTKLLIKIWLVTVFIMAVAGKGFGDALNDILSFMVPDERADSLITTKYDEIIESRFRLDFVLYSSSAILLGYYYLLKGVKDKFYIKLLNTYIISNTVWVLLIYGAYTNRTAYLSWFIMPIVMIYPLLKYPITKYQNKFIAYLILGSFGFTMLLYFK